jgi:YgiT-type zinc finger domain-containing protein
MNCIYCQGVLEQKQVSYTVNRKGYHLILDDVPA